MKARRMRETAIRLFFGLCGLFVVFVLIAIIWLLFGSSIPFFRELGWLRVVADPRWNPGAYGEPQYGIRTLMVGTLMVTVGSLLLAVPLGLACAAYLSEVASSREREILKPFVEILAGIPSVVVGFFGLVVLNPFIARIFGLGNGLNALNGSILLAVMAVPTIVSLSEDALQAVPREFREASYALGANRWQTLWRVTVPAARSGILASCMLGMGRAIGETMTVLMVTGNVRAMPGSFLDPVMTLTATIAIEMGEVAFNTLHYHGLFVVGLVLFSMTFLINVASDILNHGRRW